MALYFIGEGALLAPIGERGVRKEFKTGDKIPEGLFSKETVDSMLKKNRVSHTEPGERVAQYADDNALLQVRVADLQAQLDAANETIAGLTAQLTAPAPAEPKGGKK